MESKVANNSFASKLSGQEFKKQKKKEKVSNLFQNEERKSGKNKEKIKY